MKTSRFTRFALVAGCALAVAACGSDDVTSPAGDAVGNDTQTTPGTSDGARYEITVTNLTAGQPLSPPAFVVHSDAFRLFVEAQPASTALEALAEGADTAPLVALATNTPGVIAAEAATQGPIAPGASQTREITLPGTADAASAMLSAVTMLVNTNDAIGAVRGVDLASLAVGDEQVRDMGSYDTGTEANDELAANIPGPAGGGSGFDAARDDFVDAVLPHPGAISRDDGLAGSALDNRHRWLDPVARVRIRRVE